MIVPIPAALMATVVISSFALYHDGTRGSPESPFLAENLAVYHGQNVALGRAQAEERLTGPHGQATSHGYYNNGRELSSGSMPVFANMGSWESVIVRLPNDDLAVITWPGTESTTSNGNGNGNGNSGANKGNGNKTVECTTTEVVQAVTGNGKGNGKGNSGGTTTTTTCSTTETTGGSTGGTSGGTSAPASGSGGSSSSVTAAFDGASYEKSVKQILASLQKTVDGNHEVGRIEVAGNNNTFSIGGQTFKLNGMTIPVGAPAVLTSFPEEW